MESRKILLDTSIFIDHFRKQIKSGSALSSLALDFDFAISTVSAFEIKVGLNTPEKQYEYREMIDYVDILPFDALCVDSAVRIYQTLKKANNLIDIPDLFIAATALRHSLPVATLNKKHFAIIPDLELVPLL